MNERELIVGLDVDDVLLDLVPRWLEEYNEAYDDNLAKHDITAWEFWKFAKPGCGKHIYDFLEPKMYEQVEAIEGAAEFTRDIRNRGHTPRYITACGDPKNAKKHKAFATAKWDALIRLGIAEDSELLIPGRDKSHAPVDMLIDDRVHNVTEFRNGMSVLFSQPWNQWHDTPHRAESFTEALALIDYYREEGP